MLMLSILSSLSRKRDLLSSLSRKRDLLFSLSRKRERGRGEGGSVAAVAVRLRASIQGSLRERPLSNSLPLAGERVISRDAGRLRYSLAVVFALLHIITAHAAEPARIPLVAGLSVTTAIAEPSGDYESRKRLLGRAGAGWRMLYNTEQASASGKLERYESERLIHDADLAAARSYRSRFEANTEEDYPGTTALGASALVLQDLRSTGRSRFTLVGEDRFIATALAAMPGAKTSVLDLAGALMAGSGLSFKGELQRKSSGQLSVLVNGVAHALPVLVASGRFVANNGQSMDAELSLLDDPANPLALQWRIGNSQLRAVRIDYPAPAASLATAFQQQKRVVLPGLYFDFGSAVLRAESTAALPAILEAIRSAPKSQLLLEGHTDAIGDASRNQALSLARAQAVRSALIARDATLAPRLSARGLGSAKPIASNQTLEGRAQNRRVELVARVSHGGIE